MITDQDWQQWNNHLAITEPITLSLFEIQPAHETPDELSGMRDGWARTGTDY